MLIPERQEGYTLAEKKDEGVRSIRFPKRIWQEIDKDADRCERTSLKHMLAIFKAYFKLEDVDLIDMNAVRERVKKGAVKRGTPRTGKRNDNTGTHG